MARTEFDKYHRIVWASERGYYNDMFVLGYLLDRVAESPDLLDGLLAISPEAIVQQLETRGPPGILIPRTVGVSG